MGLWDWVDEQYPAPGSGSASNGFAPPAASGGSPFLRLLQQAAVGGKFYGDDPRATQAARGASQVPEQFARFAWPYPQIGSPRWPSPSNPVSPMPAPSSPASVATDDTPAAQAAPAGAGRLVGVVRRKGNQPDVPPPAASASIDDAADAQAAREAWMQRMKEAAKPERGHRNEGAVTQWIVDHWPEILLTVATRGAPEATAIRMGSEVAIHGLINLLGSTTEAGRGEEDRGVKARDDDPSR